MAPNDLKKTVDIVQESWQKIVRKQRLKLAIFIIDRDARRRAGRRLRRRNQVCVGRRLRHRPEDDDRGQLRQLGTTAIPRVI